MPPAFKGTVQRIGKKARRARFSADVAPALQRWFAGRTEPVRVLDIGGTAVYWSAVADLSPVPLDIDAVNLRGPDPPRHTTATDRVRITERRGDATALEIGRYDLVYSNSVIEHLGDLEAMAKMAAAVRAGAEHYIVQTPNRAFPIEPHYLLPWVQYLPITARAVCGVVWHQGPRWVPWEEAYSHAAGLRLLSKDEFQTLFPDATLVPEPFGPLVKSYTAIR